MIKTKMEIKVSKMLLQASILISCSVILAGGNPMLAPTSTWSSGPRNDWSGGVGSEPSEQYPRGSNLGNLPRTLNYVPPAPSGDRYNIRNSRRPYQYGYQRQNIDPKSHSMEYDLGPSYQHDANIYDYAYTESSNYNDQNNHNYGSNRHVVAGSGGAGGGRMSRRYGDRVWWSPLPLTSMGHEGESFIERPETSSQLMGRPLGSSDGGNARRYHYGNIVGSPADLRVPSGNKENYNDEAVVQNDSLIGMVRVQKSLQPGRDIHRGDFAVVQAIESTTMQPGSPKPKQRGIESLLKLMNEEEAAKLNVQNGHNVPSSGHQHSDINNNRPEIVKIHHNEKSINNNKNYNSYTIVNPHKNGTETVNNNDNNNMQVPVPTSENRVESSSEMNKVKHLPRVGEAGRPSTPVTTTAVLGSIMLLIIILMVMVALRVQWRERVKDAEDWGAIRSPTVQPATPAATGIGASSSTSNHLDPLNHLQAEPIRIKAKGLLERRGSNTSLTLELAPNCQPPEVTSPPRHCTPEEFLMTAGNRMSRRQLRNCLRETRALHAEFWEVPLNHPDKCDVPGSGAKNRYRTVLPNEGTRVRLDNGDPNNDYINANYIRGYDGEEKAYIATQGPLEHTVVDLWTLVMQERAPAVVMITRLKEKRRVKCEPYIPSFDATYGDITVTVKQVIHKNGYTIRQIHLQKGEMVHETLHFWYTTWPDHKTPSEADQLLAMALEVDHVRKSGERGPVVVHCSAGIGRSGCFVAISIAINQLLEEDCVDILGILCQMRLDRGGMVQTGEQYEFIHRAVALYDATLPVVCSSGK